MKPATLYAIVFLVTISFSCKDDDSKILVDLDTFDVITENYPFANVSPSQPNDYWELVRGPLDGQPQPQILFSAGRKCADATNLSVCSESLNATMSSTGFSNPCAPDEYCFLFIRYQKGDDISRVISTNELLSFLGTIDTKSDAILVAMAYNYHISVTMKEIGAIKETADGYEILATQLVKICSPVQTDRFLLKITRNGEIKILKEEVYSSSPTICI